MDSSLYAYPDDDRTWVRVTFVATLDGSAQDADGVSGSLGGAPDKEAFDVMRALADVVLVTAGTARAEGYGPIDAPPVLALASRSLDVPAALRVDGVLVVTSRSADPDAVEALRADGVEVLQHGDDEVDWPSALADLRSRGLTRVLCEGGPSLHGELAALDLVDELCLTIAPVLAGGDGRRIAHGPPAGREMRLGHVVQRDDVLLTRWVRARS